MSRFNGFEYSTLIYPNLEVGLRNTADLANGYGPSHGQYPQTGTNPGEFEDQDLEEEVLYGFGPNYNCVDKPLRYEE